MSGITTLCAATVAGGWTAIVAGDMGVSALSIPLPLHSTALAILIVGSLLVGLVWILRGPGYYKAMRLGEAVAEEKARRRVARATAVTPPQRVGVTTG